MAAVDPYSPCPCGSGQKFKWCCQKVEALAERAQRLFENGQAEAAIEAVDEGLKKEPGNAWLLTRKALYLIRQHAPEPAKDALRQVLRQNPAHLGASILLTRLVLETEGGEAGAAQFQQTITSLPVTDRPVLAALARLVGALLSQAGFYAAALAHLKLAASLSDKDQESSSSLRTIESNGSVPVWLKNPYTLAEAPDGLSTSQRDQFNQALGWAKTGLWSSAAAAFEMLSSEAAASAPAERNLGLCRLWMADDPGASEAFARYAGRLGVTTEAVDFEALRQSITEVGPDDQVEHVQLIWPVRDRDALLKSLRADAASEDFGSGPIDPEDPESPQVDQFGLLDRPVIREPKPGLRPDDIPRFVARIHVGQEIVALEAYDDGRLDGLVERFTAIAQGAIPPAHPKTKVLEKIAKATLALAWEWRLPEEIDDQEAERLDREQGSWIIREGWPNTPMPFLKGKTPLEVAKAGNALVPLRAALFRLEQTNDTSWDSTADFASLRATLGLQPEPEIDPETVVVEDVHIARLSFIAADRLNDDRLAALYRQARRFGLADVLERAGRVLADRPQAWEKAGVKAITLFSELALIASAQKKTDEAFEWIKRGRQAEPAATRSATAVSWDMTELKVRARADRPEVWVPELAVVLDRYSQDSSANQILMMHLIEMGLVRMVPNPDRAGDYFVDSRPLQYLMAEYGPRVTTASGGLGVSATKGEIWTPGGPSGSGGGLWTPGSDAGGAQGGSGDKPKLIIPGR